MKKDIIFHPVKGIQVAIVKNTTELNQEDWSVIVINRNDQPVTNVFVTSKGYSNSESGDNSDQKTSTLRHFFAEIGAGEHMVVEPIIPDVFHLNNEFWVSYFIGKQIYDKKFIFVPDSIVEANLLHIDPPGLPGVLHD
ncbi:hypothetical protein [Dyadobacter arcticus]|uniref:Uncharacterized protein n=1 Tax=Dyadobacter arcticus TaxID=1078754 RepID=A0ABX0UFT5_9BACT|nr:hypothetical protein [Dyadobacter arcticus]NIJ50919.1 hypothetical protein [Dyadobacter arcticus]